MVSRTRTRDEGGADFTAPVQYADIRHGYQQARAGIALILVALGVIAAFSGAGTSFLKPAAYGLLLADAMWRLAGDSTSPRFLLLDFGVIGAVAGFGPHLTPPLIAFVATLVTASLLMLSARTTLILLVCAAILVTLRTAVLPVPSAAEPRLAELLSWAETAVLLAALAFAVLAAVDAVRRAQDRQAGALRAEQRASELKNEFVSMVSHELRTPLTNIAGFAMAARESWRDLDPAELDEFLDIICNEAGHLTNVVDDVLVIPRLEAGRLLLESADFRLGPAAFRIADLLFPPGGDRSASVSIPGNVVVHADPNRVEQILRNLIENARKYGGTHVGIDAMRDQDRWLIVISDNGPGVPEDQRETIFNRFEQLDTGNTREHGGLGLGLTITRLLVEAMGGKVWYEPGFPVGARFCFTLPAGVAAAASAPAEAGV